MHSRTLARGLLVLLLTAAWLYARADASLVYFATLGIHVALGVLLTAGALLAIRNAFLRPSGAAEGVIAALLSVAAVSGIAILFLGAARPFYWLLQVHVLSGAAAAVVVGARWLAAHGATVPRWFGVAALAAVALGAGGRVYDRQAFRAKHRIVNPELTPVTMEGEGGGPKSPFFPSSSQTNVGGIIPSNFFMDSASAAARCHKDIYEQWNGSVHHFASFNNQWYRKSIEYMQDVVGTKPSKWCAGCHDHAVFFNGRFDRPIKEQIDTPEAQTGLGCTSCHSITHVDSTMGQGDFTIEYPPLHDLAASENPVLAWSHDYLLKLDPEPHRRTFMKPFIREQTAEFCSSCHKVHLDVPVNDYRWFRGFNEYDNWQASRRLRAGRALLLLPAEVAELRRLPHAAGRLERPRQRATARSTRTASPAPTPRSRS